MAELDLNQGGDSRARAIPHSALPPPGPRRGMRMSASEEHRDFSGRQEDGAGRGGLKWGVLGPSPWCCEHRAQVAGPWWLKYPQRVWGWNQLCHSCLEWGLCPLLPCPPIGPLGVPSQQPGPMASRTPRDPPTPAPRGTGKENLLLYGKSGEIRLQIGVSFIHYILFIIL